MKLRIAITAGLLHLVLVIIGAAELNLPGDNFAARAIRFYASLSAANANYSFFAPSVGSPLRATFHFTDADGRQYSEDTDAQAREVTLRFGNMVDAFRNKIDNEPVRRSIAASWSGRVLAKYPAATKVRFVLDEYQIPTMAEYRAGQTMSWKEDYVAQFERRRKP